MRNFLAVLFISTLIFACNRGSKSTIKGTFSDFLVEDTASIDKIFLADKSNQTVLLERKVNSWMVNGKYTARYDLINELLNTIKKVSVMQFVPKGAVENILKQLAVASIKVEIYQHQKLVKTYYVGSPTQNSLGTYMLIDGSDTPFICYIPGFRGYLSPYYMPLEGEWISRQIFNHRPSQIQWAKAEFAKFPEISWKIENPDNKNFKLLSLQSNQYIQDFDTNRVKDVLSSFAYRGFEQFTTANKDRLDSVLVPKYYLGKLSILDKDNVEHSVTFYQLPYERPVTEENGEISLIDPEKMYGVVNEFTTICQYYTFDPLLVPIEYFLPKKNKNK